MKVDFVLLNTLREKSLCGKGDVPFVLSDKTLAVLHLRNTAVDPSLALFFCTWQTWDWQISSPIDCYYKLEQKDKLEVHALLLNTEHWILIE